MRRLLCWGSLLTAAVITASCASPAGEASSLASAAARTARGSSRVELSLTMHNGSMSMTFTQAGAFDYAHSQGYLRSAGHGMPIEEEVFLPPHVYLKVPRGTAGPFGHGKTWIAFNLAGERPMLPLAASPFQLPVGPSEILSSLEGVASHVTQVGSATIRGVQTVHYRAQIDLAKLFAKTGQGARAGGLMRALGGAPVTAQAWVDGTGLVRRVLVRFAPGKHSGAPPGTQFAETVDFYDFGLPVRVSAPPASEVMSPSQPFGDSSGNGGSLRPPPAAGTLSPAQASAAEQAVRAFWAGLDAGDRAAASRAVLPSQRKCFLSGTRHMPRVTVGPLRIISARPDKTGHATVLFTANVRLHVQGHSIPLSRPPAAGGNWLAATADGAGWYVDLARSAPYFPFTAPCGSVGYSSSAIVGATG